MNVEMIKSAIERLSEPEDWQRSILRLRETYCTLPALMGELASAGL